MYTKNCVWQAGDIPTAAHFNNLEKGIFNGDGGRICFVPQHYDAATGTYTFDTGERFSYADGEMFCFRVGEVNGKTARICIDNTLARPICCFSRGILLTLPEGRLMPGRIYKASYLAAENCFLLDSDICSAEYYGESMGAGIKELFICGGSARLALTTGGALAFSALAMARRGNDGLVGCWELSGAARRGSGGIFMAGAVVKSFWGGDPAFSSYDVSAQVNTTAQAVTFHVKGGAADNVCWRICVKYTEIRLS